MATKYNTIQYTSDDLSTEEIVISKEHWLKYEQLSIANWQIWKSQNSLKLYYDEKGILRLNTSMVA